MSLLIENTQFQLQETESKITLLQIDKMSLTTNGVYGLKAPNGSGKTSFLNCLFRKPKYNFYGNILVNDIDLNHLTTEDMFKQGYAFLQQNNIELPNVTYYDLIISTTNINEIKEFTDSDEVKKDIILREKTEEFGISYSLLKKEIGACSSGERKVLDLFLFSIFNMDVIFFDELDANLDEKNKQILIDFVIKNKSKKIFFIISHDQNFLNDCQCKTIFTINKMKKIVKIRKIDSNVL